MSKAVTRETLLDDGYVLVMPDQWDVALRSMGTKDHIRREILSTLEDRGNIELLVHHGRGHMATCQLDLE